MSRLGDVTSSTPTATRFLSPPLIPRTAMPPT
eukprot:CAMPEP_0198218014 /NCGR_PEP_ID=MMETSP1445-20131203/66921_1 /TAXON_ID=36898 /ORGANISM="Pyramimonas sp., Strain CCMP2087" /LENGTH=31 /DNA_ID= /DNA_START= /DNA_END= /DNA_ORIENTATION=